MLRDLKGKVVAVIGASSGMGRATAVRFARAGAVVAIGGRNVTKLNELAQTIGAEGGKVLAESVDVQKQNQVEQWFEWVESQLGRVDVVVYASGTNAPDRAIRVLEAKTWKEILETNLSGAFYCTKAALPRMLEQKDGLIIYVSSVSAKRVDKSGAAYQASKRGMDGLVHGAMGELKGSGVRMTVVYPGLTNTPLIEKRPEPTPAEQLAKALQPEDVAEACFFVASMPERVSIPEIVLSPSALREHITPGY